MKHKYIDIGHGISVSVPIREAQDFTQRMHAETQGMNFDQLNNWIQAQHYNYPTKIRPMPMGEEENNIIRFGDAEGRYADPNYSGHAGQGGQANTAGSAPASLYIPIWIPLSILFLMLASLISA